MQNTLSIDMKIPNIWDFPKKLHSLSVLCAEYSENSGHLVQFFQKIGKFAILCTNNHKSNTLVGGKLKKNQDFPQTVNNFHKISATLYVVI